MSSNNLINTIINAPEPQLRALIQTLLTSDDDALRNKILAAYSAIHDANSHGANNKRKAEFDQDVVGSPADATGGRPETVQTCVRCKQSFLPSRSSGQAQECLYHPGVFFFPNLMF